MGNIYLRKLRQKEINIKTNQAVNTEVTQLFSFLFLTLLTHIVLSNVDLWTWQSYQDPFVFLHPHFKKPSNFEAYLVTSVNIYYPLG
jgi:hypothetical protein